MELSLEVIDFSGDKNDKLPYLFRTRSKDCEIRYLRRNEPKEI